MRLQQQLGWGSGALTCCLLTLALLLTLYNLQLMGRGKDHASLALC